MSTKWVVAVLALIAVQFVHSAFINETCSSNNDCGKNVKYSYCLESKCSCISTFYFVDRHKIKRCAAPPSHKCNIDGSLNCTPHATCINGTCDCNPDYIEDSIRPGSKIIILNVCSKNISVTFNETCEGDKQCQKNDYYSRCGIKNRCKCYYNFERKNISGKILCTIPVAIGDKCNERRVCPKQHSTCQNSICVCNSGYKPYGDFACSSDSGVSHNEDNEDYLYLIIAGSIGAIFVVGFFIFKLFNQRVRKRTGGLIEQN